MPADPTYDPGRPASRSRDARRAARARAKPRPRASTPPRPAPRAAMPGDPGYGTGPDVRARAPAGSTSSRVTVTRRGRAVRPASRKPARDPLDEVLARHDEDVDRQARPAARVGVQAAGLPDDWQRRAALAGDTPLGFLRNVGGDLMDILTGIPAAGQLGAENVAAFNPVSVIGRGAREAGAPGLDWLASYQDRVAGIDRQAAQGVADAYAYQYGPFVRGDWREGARRAGEHPLNVALDLAGGKAIIGRAPAGVARATRAVAPRSRVAARAQRRYSGLSAADRARFAANNDLRTFEPGEGGLYRQPRRITMRPAEPEPGRKPLPDTTVEVPRRAYSRDFINRSVQRAADRRRERKGPEREAKAQARLPIPGQRPVGIAQKVRLGAEAIAPRTAQGKVARYQKAEALNLRDRATAREEAVFANNSPAAVRAINRLTPVKNAAGTPVRDVLSVEQAAARLHLDDVLPEPGKLRGGKSASQIRDLWVRGVQGRQTTAREKGGYRTDRARQQVEAVRSIPDDLLYLTGDSPAVRRVRAAVAEGRRLDRISQAQSVKAGVITRTTAKEAATRASALTVGGSRYWTEAVGKVARDFGRKITVVNRRIDRAKAEGNAPEVRRLTTEKIRLVRARRGRVAYIKEQATRKTPELVAQREATATARAKLSRERAVVKTAGGSTRAVEAARLATDRHMKRLAKMEDAARGFTTPRRPELVGKRGVYIPDRPVDPTGGYTGPKPAGRFSGPDKARRSKGVLKSAAMHDMNPNLLIHQAKRATSNWTGRISQQALNELIATAAYRTADGGLLTGNKVSLARKVDPSRVAWVHKGNLVKAIKDLDELPEGKWLPDGQAREVVTDVIPDGAKAGDYVAISKDAADVWTAAMTRVPGLDTFLNWWKGGLLALSPRWYVNNSFGLALQYAVLSGGDFRAVFQANRASKPIRAAITRRSPQGVKDTLADDLVGGASLPKVMRAGFRVNSKLEEFWRRSAYLNRAKKSLRGEGARLRDMSDAQVAKAIETMPESMARDILRDLDFFIGNYRKFNAFERDVVKRVVPFYSWLRVVARLTFVLPFRSPSRVLAMRVLSEAQKAGLNPLDPALDYFERGSLSFGNLKIPTWTLNPWQSLTSMIDAVGDDSPFGRMLEENMGWMHPAVQLVYSQASGNNAFGQGLIAPPGTKLFGLDPYNINEVTGRPQRQKVRVPIVEALVSTLAPGQVSLIRRIAANGRTPWGTTTTQNLLVNWMSEVQGGPTNAELFLDSKGTRGRTATKANPYTGAFGTPTYWQDDAKVLAEDAKDRRRQRDESSRLARERR